MEEIKNGLPAEAENEGWVDQYEEVYKEVINKYKH
jgi:hypothetical protein